jgi:proline racemase
MRFSKFIECIDTHTVGEATRITIAGLPFLKGNTVMEQKQDMAANHDWLRKIQIFEPRGHIDMFGALLVKPNHPEADFGVIFTDSGGYLNMCGHGTIGLSTTLVETGYVKMVEPYTTLNLEAPAGLIRVKVKVTAGRVESVTFTNVPAFVYKKDCEINLPGVGKVKFDISFGGSFFAIVHASQLKFELKAKNLGKMVPAALQMRDIINKEIKVKHPTLPINEVDLVEIYDKPDSKDADAKNVVIFGDGNVDRSPCGTGTSAKLALLHSEGKIGLNKPFVYESILNTKFTGQIIEETTVGEFKAVVPQITGSAYITGFNKFVIDENDPLKAGFLLGQ